MDVVYLLPLLWQDGILKELFCQLNEKITEIIFLVTEKRKGKKIVRFRNMNGGYSDGGDSTVKLIQSIYFHPLYQPIGDASKPYMNIIHQNK